MKLLRLDWPKAALKKRTVVVGAIENAVKTQEYNGVLVQFDLSPTSKVQYDRYRANTAYQLAKGVVTPEQVTRIKATAELAKNGDNVYTVAKFAIAP